MDDHEKYILQRIDTSILSSDTLPSLKTDFVLTEPPSFAIEDRIVDKTQSSPPITQTARKTTLRVIPTYQEKPDNNSSRQLSKSLYNAFGFLDPKNNRTTLYLEASLKEKILNIAIETKTSPSGVILPILLKYFPESMPSESDCSTKFNQPHKTTSHFPEYNWNSRFAQRQINSVKGKNKTQINIYMPEDMIRYFETKALDGNCLLSRNQLIVTTLELELDNDDEFDPFIEENNEPE